MVAYAPLIDNLQAAIAEFTKSSSTGDEKVIGQNIEEALVIVRGFVEKLNALTGEEWRKLEAIGEQHQARLQLLAKLRNPHTVDEKVLLQSGAGSARELIETGIPAPVVLAPQAPAKAFATITASAFGFPKANTLPCPLRSACIASMPCSAR